jgi:hypothetical protein
VTEESHEEHQDDLSQDEYWSLRLVSVLPLHIPGRYLRALLDASLLCVMPFLEEGPTEAFNWFSW